MTAGAQHLAKFIDPANGYPEVQQEAICLVCFMPANRGLTTEDNQFVQDRLKPQATAGNPASPDDVNLSKYKNVLACRLCEGLHGAKQRCRGGSFCISESIFDYSCIEQDDIDELIRGVNSQIAL